MSWRRARITRPMWAVLSFLALAWFLPPAAVGQSTALPQKVVSLEGITEYRLDNGLRLLLFPDPSAANVTVNITILVGSRHEGYGETGMAHLLEHMVFKGTPTHPEVPRVLKEHGAQFNGTTWVDRTNYFETMAGTDENLEFALKLEADRLVHSLIRREDLASEMTVVRSEFEMGENSPSSVLGNRMLAAAYEWHNYGKVTIGNRSDIERVPIDRLQAFYRKYYRPDNAVLIVAGKFDTSKALEYTAKYFGALKKPALPLDDTYTEEPAQDGERTVVLRRVGKVGVVGLVYHIPAGPHEDCVALTVLSNILDSEPSGRLYKALVEARKATGVSATAFNWHDPGVFQIEAEVEKGHTPEEIRDVALAVIERLGGGSLTDEEVERAKRQILKDRERLMTRSNQIGVTLSNWAATGDWRLFFLYRDRVAKVSRQDVTRVAERYFQKANRTVGLYIPSDKVERVAIPATPPVAELVKNYQGGAAVAAGEVFEPTPENIEKRVERFELPSGLKVALFPKKTRGQSVIADLTLRYGNEESIKGHTSATQFLARLMGRGTQKMTLQQLRDRLDHLGARLGATGLLGEADFNLECKRVSLLPTLQVLGEILREPSFPAHEFDILKREVRTGLEQDLAEPMPLAMREMQRRLSPYPPEDVRYVPTTEESIQRLDAVTVEEVGQLYKDQFSAQAGEFVVVGDFDPAEVRQWLRSTLGDWKSAIAYRRIERPARLDVSGAREVIKTPDKANALYLAGHSIALGDTDPDYPAMEVADFLFGGGTLSSRLGNRVRQKEGLSYGVNSHLTVNSMDRAARFMMMAICNPANIDKVDQAISEEFGRLLREGVTEAELDEAKRSYLQRQKVQMANDRMVAGLLARDLQKGRTLAFVSDLENKVRALTPEAINAAVRKNLHPDKLIVIRAGDFK